MCSFGKTLKTLRCQIFFVVEVLGPKIMLRGIMTCIKVVDMVRNNLQH